MSNLDLLKCDHQNSVVFNILVMEECLTLYLVGLRILSDGDDSPLLILKPHLLKLLNIVNYYGENLISYINHE